jgi:hypothetical protein
MHNPLSTTNTPEQNERDKKLWEAEDLGGITEDNNRLPVPVVWLLLLTVVTAFAITFPLWGQRPTAWIYIDYVKSLGNEDVQAISDDANAMKLIVSKNRNNPNQSLLERHPVTMDELRGLAPKIAALAKGDQSLLDNASGDRQCTDRVDSIDPRDYTVIGTNIVCSNFEGNWRKDGVMGKKDASRVRQQPWWDKGYTIDIFYLIAFFMGVVAVVKRLPPSSWQPTHGHH